MVFGGKILTATDVAVASDKTLNIGDRELLQGAVEVDVIEDTGSTIKQLLENVIDRAHCVIAVPNLQLMVICRNENKPKPRNSVTSGRWKCYRAYRYDRRLQ